MDFKQKAKQLYSLTEDELNLSKDAILYRKILNQFSFAKNPIALFDHWLKVLLPKQIDSRPHIVTNGINTYSNVVVHPPQMYPHECRAQKETYSGMITATITYTPSAGVIGAKLITKENCEIGKIPIMLGSYLCKLSKLSDEEKVNLGECFNDHFGYFIIKGTEKIIIIQEQLAYSQPIIYNKNDRFETRFTSHTDVGTSLVSILPGKKWKTLEIKLFSSLSQHIPLFVCYEIIWQELYPNSTRDEIVQQALEEIFQFVKEEDKQRVKFSLYPSMAELQTIGEGKSIDFMMGEREKIINKKIEAAKRQKKNFNLEAMKDSKERVVREIFGDLFPNVPRDHKSIHLSMMVAQTLLSMLGIRPYDNRDGWENKSLQAPANSLEQLTNALWTNVIERESKDNPFNIQTSILTDGFVTAFGPNAWGTKNASRKENITAVLLRESVVSVFSQILKCNTPASRQLRDSKVRQLQGSQNGYICIAETPEGPNCGLNKTLASTCWISLNRNYSEFVNYISQIIDEYEPEYFLSKTKSENNPYPLTINGIIQGWVNTTPFGRFTDEIANDIIPQLKRIKRLPTFFDVCICFNNMDNKVEVYLDGCRPCRPLYVTNSKTKTLIIDSIEDVDNKSVMDLVLEGAIEFVHAREQEMLLISQYPDVVRSFQTDIDNMITELENFKISSAKAEEELLFRFNNEQDIKLKTEYYEALNNLKNTNLGIIVSSTENLSHPFFTHSEIDPQSILGVAGSTMPQSNYCQGPRVAYQCSMIKQALGPYHSVKHKRWDASFKCLVDYSRPLFETEMAEPCGLNALPSGRTPIVAYLIRENNNEDAITVKKQFIERYMRIVKYMTHTISIINSTGGVEEKFIKPAAKTQEREGRYDCIDAYGIPIIGSYIRRNDCIVGRVRKINKIEENASIYAGVGEEGIVTSVYITKTTSLGTILRVKIRSVRTQQLGDKVASRYAQKGTFGRILDEKDMPYIVGGPNDGLRPDFLISTLNVPSRMTLGKIHEIIASLACLYDNDKQRVDATAFRSFDITYYQNILEKNGFDKNAEFKMANADGTILSCPVYCGPCYYQALRHHVVDKFQVRSTGSIMPETHQPLKGRANDGGLRFGEMERDALISSGAAYLLSERLMYSSDQFTTEYCLTCGNLVNPPINNVPQECKVCRERGDTPKFGVVTIPYIFLLIMRMLSAMGLHTTLKLKDVSKFSENNNFQIIE